MNRLLLTAAPLAALALAACQPAEQKIGATPARLDCPAVQGAFKRLTQAADGKACEYRAGETEVTLQLTPVVGSAEATLANLEADLRKLKPMAPEAAEVADVESLTPPAPYDPSVPEPPSPPTPPAPPAVGADDERVEINLPGLKVKADNEGAQLRIAGVNIDADDNGAEIRRVAYSRLPGEQLSRERRGVDAFFILAGDPSGPEGYKLVGYKAGGRRDGPLTVAVVRSREPGDDVEGGQVFGPDINALLKRNGG